MKSRVMKIILTLVIGLMGVLLISMLFSQFAPMASGAALPSGNSAGLAPTVGGYLLNPVFLKNSFGYSATVYLQNLSTVESPVRLDFKNNTGTVSVDKIIPAKGTLVLPADEIPGLADGQYALVANSLEPIQSVVEVIQASDNKLASYRGIPSIKANSNLYFSPFFDDSGIVLINGSGTTSEFSINFIASDGSVITAGPYTVPDGQNYTIYGPSIPSLPAGVYLAQVTATQPMVGILVHNNLASDSGGFEYSGSLEPGTTQYLPRAMKSFQEGGLTRTTQLMVSNVSLSGTTNVTLYYRNPTSGTFQQTISLQAGDSQLIDLDTVAILPAGTVWAVTAQSMSPVPIILGEYTPSGAKTTSDYEASLSGMDQELYLPRLAGANDEFTVFSVQNAGSSADTVTISYYDLGGTLVYSQSLNMNPGEVYRENHSQIAGLGADFTGSAIVSSGQSLVGWVDVYVGPTTCQEVSNVQISRSPTGELYSGDTVLFSASAEGTTPFNYSWRLDGTAVGENTSSYEHTFNTSGSYTVGVSISNDCGQSEQSLTLDIQEGSTDRPNLSTSYKSATLKTVGTGDILTYMLVLRNTSTLTASASLTDTLPIEMSYVQDSAKSSDGHPVTYSNGEIAWSGEIITGTPVLIEFAVEVQTGTIGTPIINTAELDDGMGNITELESASLYNPGYSLSIAEGALYTDVPTVSLRFSWNAEDNIAAIKISNDGGFGTEGDTTDWIPVDPNDPTYSDWVLSTYGDLRLPRTVYIKFRDESGTPYGPFQDDIIFDPTAPQVTSIEFISIPTVSILTAEPTQVIVRVTSSDDNSGVEQVQISDSFDFTTYTSYPVMGSVTDILYDLQPSGLIYVRVKDRSGNLSEVTRELGPASERQIYLPLAIRG